MEFPNHQHHFRPHHGRSHAPPPPPSSLSGPPAPPPSVYLPHHLSHPHPHAQPPPPHPSLLLPLPLLNRQALLPHPSHAQPHPHTHAHAHMRPRKRPASDPLADPKRRGPPPPNQVAVGAALIPRIDPDSVRSRPPPADTLNPDRKSETRPIVNSRVDLDIAQSRANLVANLVPDRKHDSQTMPNTRVDLNIAQSRVNLAANLAPDRKPESRTMLNARANLDVAQSRVNLVANSGPDRKPEIQMMPNSRADLDIGQSRVNLAANSDPDIKPESRTMANARVDLGTGLALDRKPESRAMSNTRIDLDLGQSRANLVANSALERKLESRAMVDSRADLDVGQSRINLGANLASDRKPEGRMMANSRVNPGASLALDRKLEGRTMAISRGDLETGNSRADSGGGASLGLDRKPEGRGMVISRADYETGSSRVDPSLGLDRKFENRVMKLSRVDASTGLASDRKLESRVMAERDEDRGRDSSRSMPTDFSLASKKLRLAPDREEESSMGSSLGTGDKPKKKERPMDGLVFQYKTALGELTFNSKPIITNLTIIAGENQQHASKGIATTVCSHILEVPNEQKLPTLYLLDSIVKNIGGDYVKHFAARLPEVFCKSYRQVDPATHPSMQHLFKTWKGVFPSGMLREIEKELEFPSQGQTPSSNANAPRLSESPSRRPGNSIHVNPKYVEAQRQRMQQSNKLVSQNEKEDNLSAEKIPTKKVSARLSDYDYGSNNDPGPDVASSGMAAADQDEAWERGGSLRESDDGYNRCAETSSGLGYSQCNGYEQRPPSPKALVDAYGNPRGPRVPRLLPSSVLPHEVENRSRAPPRNWQSSEGYVWEEMSPKLLEHTRFRDASRKEEWFPGGDNDRNVVPVGGLDRNMIDGVGWRRQGPSLASVERPSSAESRPSMHPPLHPAVSEERSHSGVLQSSLSSGQVAFSRQRLLPTDLPSPIQNSVSTSGNGMHTSAHPADAFFGGESSLSAMPAIDGGNFQPRRMLPQRPPSPPFPPASQLQHPLSPPSFMPVEHSSRPSQNNAVEPGQHIGQPPPLFSQSSPTPPFLPGPMLPSQPMQGEQSIGLSLQSLPQLPPHVLQSLRQLQQHLPPVSGMPVPPSQSATSAHPRSSDSSSSLPLPQTAPAQLFQNQHFLQLPAPKAESSQTQAADSVESSGLPLSAFIPRGGGDGISQPGPPSPSPLSNVSSIPSESNPTQISSQLPPLPSGPPPLPLAALSANPPMLLSQGTLHPPPQPFAPVPLPPPLRHSSQLNSTLQPPLPPGPPPASSQVVTPLPLQPPALGVSPPPAINNLSSLLSSLISQGLISASASSTAPLPPQPSQTDISGGGVSGGASMSVSSIPTAQQTSAMAAVSEAPQPNATPVSDDIGTEFKQDILRVRHESVVNSLYADMPSQCKSCGFRFKCQEEHSKHMDWHTCRNRGQKTSRRWFVSAKEWLGGTGASSALEAAPSFFADEAAPATEEEEIIAVVADENQSACALCGEPFEDFYSDEMEEWMYRGAVYMNAPGGKTEGATEDTSQLGPIVHAKCRSESAAAVPVNAEDRVGIS